MFRLHHGLDFMKILGF